MTPSLAVTDDQTKLDHPVTAFFWVVITLLFNATRGYLDCV